MALGQRFELTNATGQTWTLVEGAHLQMGRSASNDLVVPDSTVSRQHALLMVAQGRCWIRDQQSTHGTFVNGQRVMGQQEVWPGDTITIGNSHFCLRVADASPAIQQPAVRQRQIMWLMASAVVIVVLLGIALASGGRNDPIAVEVGVRAPAGATVSVMPDEPAEAFLPDGATLLLAAGSVASPAELTMNKLPETERVELVANAGNHLIGPVYEIQLSTPDNRVEARLELPYDPDGISPTDQEAIAIAYYDQGRWISVVSTVDLESHTVSADLTHFSVYSWMLRASGLNKAPSLRVSPDPADYTGLSITDKVTLDGLDELYVHVYASDPEGKLQAVYAAAEAHFTEQGLADYWQDLSEQALRDCKAEAGDVEDICTTVVEELLSPPDQELEDLVWKELVDQGSGHYVLPIAVSQIDNTSSGPLEEINVYVMAVDDLTDEPVMKTAVVRFLGDDVAPAISLKSPGPSIEAICSPRPTLSWQPETDLHLYGGALQLRISKDTDLWQARRYEHEVELTTDDSNDESIMLQGEWTPPRDLPDGTHCWGVVATLDEDERDFDLDDCPLCSRSEVYCFTVDEEHTGACTDGTGAESESGFTVSGTVTNQSTSDIPDDARVLVFWPDLMEEDSIFVYGEGTIDPDALTFSVQLDGDHPEGALSATLDSQAIGIGLMFVTTRQDIEVGRSYGWDEYDAWENDFLGAASQHAVIYIQGDWSQAPFEEGETNWLAWFESGYSVGRGVYFPEETFDGYEPVTADDVDIIIIDDLDQLEWPNWS